MKTPIKTQCQFHQAFTKITAFLIMIVIIGALEAQQRNNNRAGNRPRGGARAGENGFVAQLGNRDTDKSGTLSKEELSGGRMGIRDALFKAVDLDGNGQISMGEAKAADKIETYGGTPKQIEFEGKSWNATHAIGADVVEFNDKQALHIVGREQCLVYLPVDDFQNGTIEVDMAGDIFTGIAFRVRDNGKRSEKVYFRPQNAGTARHENSVQYSVIGRADGHWSALRRNHPGKYETGADIKQSEWFHVRLEIKDAAVEVFVNDKTLLKVDPMLDGISKGSIGVWGWDSYFANFKYEKN